MPTERLKKHTLQLREGDWDELTDYFQPRGVSTSIVIRRLVSNYVNKLRAAAESVPTPTEEPPHE